MITTINEFRKTLQPINEMSYASLQGEIDAFTAQLQELEANNGDPKQIEILKRKIDTRSRYIDRLKSGRKTASVSTLNPGETITYNNEPCIIVSIEGDNVQLANSSTTLNGQPVRITHVEGNKIFVNTSKGDGTFNNFAKGISLDQLENLITVPTTELIQKPEPRQPREKKPKVDRQQVIAIRQIIRSLNKNIDSVQSSLNSYKDRTAEEQAAIFQKRYGLQEYSIEQIVTALQQMGLVDTTAAVSEDFAALPTAKGYPVTHGVLFDKLNKAIPNAEFNKVSMLGKWEIIDGQITTTLSIKDVENKLKAEFGRQYIVATKALGNNTYQFRLYSTRSQRQSVTWK